MLGDVVVSSHIIGYEFGEAISRSVGETMPHVDWEKLDPEDRAKAPRLLDFRFRPTHHRLNALDLDRVRTLRDDPTDYKGWRDECLAAAPEGNRGGDYTSTDAQS